MSDVAILRKGDVVRVRHVGDSEWCIARVAIASANGKSVALYLDDAVRANDGIIAGVLPLNINFEAESVTGLTGDEYEIEVKGSTGISL